MAYILVGDSMGLSSFKFLWWAPKDASFLQQSAYRPFKVIQGRWFWHQSKGRMDFLLVVNSNFGPILHCFWNTATYWLKIANFPYPTSHLTPSLGVNPFKFLDDFFIPKTRVFGLSVGEDFVILACVVFTQCQRVTDGRTDRHGRTDGLPTIASTGLAATLTPCTNHTSPFNAYTLIR